MSVCVLQAVRGTTDSQGWEEGGGAGLQALALGEKELSARHKRDKMEAKLVRRRAGQAEFIIACTNREPLVSLH
jgi:hypothetical protein